jgi:hypothetical protein
LLHVSGPWWRRRVLGSTVMVSRWLTVVSIIAGSAILLGVRGIYLKHLDPAPTDPSQQQPIVNRSGDAQEATEIGRAARKSDAVHRRDVLPATESYPPQEATLQSHAPHVEPDPTRESGVPGRTSGDSAPAGEAPLDLLLYSVSRRLDVHRHHDLLRFILDEEIRETGLDVDAALSIEAAISEIAAARGAASGVGSGYSDIQCTVSLCTLLLESRGAFQMTRLSPEFQAMMEQGPVSMVSWVGLGTREREGHLRFYLYRSGMEQHSDLLEAVVAGP